ncbi:AraC family transcriptional regulator [Flavobacterium sp. DG1-102-2]|uniref:AraC family transcriptional regulator n=1 Tax=Flavobacterium sp. DG1-102-2 TaxID=3081663 RepID=UPI0029493482|nr:AraC family transcriptional regulator [Flavobacterium sp. DG1-102-2]MDV6167925.1 AraC family transcriptional regulator [Flavobacterium sp. DG1-102-2]
METISFEGQLSPDAAVGKTSVVPYASATPIVKEMSRLEQNMISLITEGEKLIYSNGEAIHVTPNTIMLLAGGSYIFTERFAENTMLRSTILLFDNSLLEEILPKKKSAAEQKSHVFFPRDKFVLSYVDALQHLQQSGNKISGVMAKVKVSELLLYLSDAYPDIFNSFQPYAPEKTSHETLKKAVEQNLSNFLSVKEIAFLCNMSVPTFKRHFNSVYKTSPAKWMQERRLEMAALKIKGKKARPTDLYLDAGYNSHSAFSQAFKRHFGILPSDYSKKHSL